MNFYLNKYGFLNPQITTEPVSDLNLIVVIPCYNEPDLISSLDAIENCHVPEKSVEIIIVLNSSEVEEQSVLEQNLKTITQFNDWNINRQFAFHLIHCNDLPKKHAGVGLARKIGMDEAVARFDKINHDGIIVCFDADSQCDPNYIIEIEKHFIMNANSTGCAIHFEHPIHGEVYSEDIYKGIINYELHLRYYKQCLHYCDLPYAFHTVGSSMAVKSSAYQKQGGMNKRKAGEDFYFIHKIIALGGFSEIKSTKVIPSPRPSDRVPFGTGKAIQEWLDKGSDSFDTYNFQSFQMIKKLVSMIPDFYNKDTSGILDLNQSFQDFLAQDKFPQKLDEIQNNSSDLKSFTKRFFVWFDAFKVLKLVHYLRDNALPNIRIEVAAKELISNSFEKKMNTNNATELLSILRMRDLS